MKRQCNICETVLPTVLVLLFCCPLAAQEISVGWHDQMYLQPGDGVQLNRQQEPVFPGLVVMPSTGLTNGNTGDQQTYIAFAQHTYDMLKSLSANASVSLNYATFSGDANFSFFGRQTFNANDLTFVVTIVRNFGTTRFEPINLSSNFWVQATKYGRTLHGPELYSALTRTFGTHYVAGYKSAAMASVLYSFHYASAATKQRFDASANASWSFGNFSGFVSSFFASTNATKSMSYQFYSTDPNLIATNFGFASAGVVTNLQQFSTVSSNVQRYANAFTRGNAKINGYILDPLWFAPDVLPMLEGYVPPPAPQPNYDAFLQAYTALQARKQIYDPWILDGNALSWLNRDGQRTVRDSWAKAGSYLAAMKDIAARHYNKNEPLSLPPGITEFLANLSEISLPAIYVIDSFVSGDRYIIGRVDCGCRDLTMPIPFNTISQLYYGTNRAVTYSQDAISTIYYDPVDFQNVQLAAYPSGTVRTHLTNLFSGNTGHWNCLTNPATNPNLNGFFLAHESTAEAPRYTLAISSGTDVNRNTIVVDELGFLDTLSGDCPGSCMRSIRIW